MKILALVLTALIICLTPIQVFAVNKDNESTTLKVGKYVKSEAEYSEYIKAQPSEKPDNAISIPVNCEVREQPFSTSFSVKNSGLFTLGLSYKPIDETTTALVVGIMIDGKYPFEEASKLNYPKMWMDESLPISDNNGNTYSSQQKIFQDYYLNYAVDISGRSSDLYSVFLTSGKHEVTIIPIEGMFDLNCVVFGVVEDNKSYNANKIKSNCYYNGEPIIYEAEHAYLKSNNWLIGKSELFSANVSPSNPTHSLINYIGGSNWKTAGETIVWKITVPSDGYYSLGFSFRQNTILNSNCYRHLKIDGSTPFKEAEQIPFEYDDKWQYKVWSDTEENPYLLYLTKGGHQLSLTVTGGEMKNAISLFNDLASEIGDLYRDITMITGESVDTYRDYDLFVQIPDMNDKLTTILKQLESTNQMLKKVTGHASSSYTSVLNNMIRIVKKMVENKYIAHRYLDSYYSGYSSISAVLSDMKNMPLDIDKIIFYSPNEVDKLSTQNFLKNIWFSILRFVSSFSNDYTGISKKGNEENVTIWVGWGRDQAQVLKSLLRTNFTPMTNISANVKVVNASVIQALLSGNGPDCILQHSRTEPVNLAMRGALYDLSNFNDCQDVLNRFVKGADIPYRYKGGLYALPDTQSFYMMYYRTDVFDELGIEVPETWDDFKEVSKLLLKNNLSVWMPYTQITDMSMANSGIGSLSLFPTMLLQNGLSMYEKDGKKTTLSDPKVISVFQQYTDFYTKLCLPVTMSFYNRFRSGTTPLGIDLYNLYTTISAAAPEIDGRWSMVKIPGTVKKDGTVVHTSSGGGTGCAILSTSKNKDAAWELLKWWTDAATQLSFSNNVESVLGPTGRIAVSNTEALNNMSWNPKMKKEIFEARDDIAEIPEYPGSYYISRSIDHSFWNVVNSNKLPKDMLVTWGEESDEEIARKWAQYE